MSRSTRRSPVVPITTAKSDKWTKRMANRLLRRRVSQAMIHGDEVLPMPDEVFDMAYLCQKDGHFRFFDVKPDDPGWSLDRYRRMMGK